MPTTNQDSNNILDKIMEDETLLYLSITPFLINGKKILQVRGQIHDKERVQKILEKAFADDSVPAKIIIRDKFKAYLRCTELGFIQPKQNSLIKK